MTYTHWKSFDFQCWVNICSGIGVVGLLNFFKIKKYLTDVTILTLNVKNQLKHALTIED